MNDNLVHILVILAWLVVILTYIKELRRSRGDTSRKLMGGLSIISLFYFLGSLGISRFSSIRRIVNWLDVTHHKIYVLFYVIKVCLALLRRGIVHDLSKYSKEEFTAYEESFFDLLRVKYGSKEYFELQKKIKPAKEHHFKINTHHPEHHLPVIEFMSPLDLIEMLCDWKAATKGHKDGNFMQSILINTRRYPFSPSFMSSMIQDAREIGLLSNGPFLYKD